MPSTPADSVSHVFNDDLLVHKGDARFAETQFPRIIHVLNNPRLKAEFMHYEKAANSAREKVRLFGFAVVIAPTLALIALATKPFWHNASDWARFISISVEL